MAEILLCVRDMGADSGQPVIEHRRPKRGDVIVVREDGWPWGELEMGGRWADPGNGDDTGFVQGELVYTEITNGKARARAISEHPRGNHNCFRIIKLPNCTVSELQALLSPELNSDPRQHSPYLQYRAFFLDKDKIPGVAQERLRDFWDDDGRVDGSLILNVSFVQLQNFISQRSRVPL
jgi:hypothetical protein